MIGSMHPSSRHLSIRHRAGLSLVEVLMSVAILVTVLAAAFTGLFNLHSAQQTAHEYSVAQRTAQIIAERIMGATWSKLGQEVEPWSWHRRSAPRALRVDGGALTTATPPTYSNNSSPRNPPMTETAANASNLIALGLVSGPTGVRDLTVYVEYYDMNAMNRAGTDLVLRGGGGTAANVLIFPPRAPANAAEAGVDFGLPESWNTVETDHLDLTRDAATGDQINEAVLVRILVTWSPAIGGTRRHQLLIARKQ